MQPEPLKSFPLPWNQAAHYWLCILPERAAEADAAAKLQQLAFTPSHYLPGGWIAKAPRQWGPVFERAAAALGPDALTARGAVITDGEHEPTAELIQPQLRPVADIAFIARSLWLGEVLRDQRIRSYMQPIMDKRGKIFGHEAFARALGEDGRVIAGGPIISASRDLNIEHMLDRYLQVHAVRTFIESDLGGFLFINFTPGFIHRPEIYLEGMTDTVLRCGLSPKHIVLDITRAETPRDAQHLKAIFDYCRAKGYSTALDDIATVETATRLIAEAQPDFLKLDIDLVRNAENAGTLNTILQLVELAHAAGCSVIAEGVETKIVHTALLKAGVDLFQGYLFSPAVASATGKRETEQAKRAPQ